MFGNSVLDSNYGPWPDRPLGFKWLKGGSQKALRCVSIERNFEMWTVPEGRYQFPQSKPLLVPFIF
jgi:hypothetical protein